MSAVAISQGSRNHQFGAQVIQTQLQPDSALKVSHQYIRFSLPMATSWVLANSCPPHPNSQPFCLSWQAIPSSTWASLSYHPNQSKAAHSKLLMMCANLVMCAPWHIWVTWIHDIYGFHLCTSLMLTKISLKLPISPVVVWAASRARTSSHPYMDNTLRPHHYIEHVAHVAYRYNTIVHHCLKREKSTTRIAIGKASEIREHNYHQISIHSPMLDKWKQGLTTLLSLWNFLETNGIKSHAVYKRKIF